MAVYAAIAIGFLRKFIGKVLAPSRKSPGMPECYSFFVTPKSTGCPVVIVARSSMSDYPSARKFANSVCALFDSAGYALGCHPVSNREMAQFDKLPTLGDSSYKLPCPDHLIRSAVLAASSLAKDPHRITVL